MSREEIERAQSKRRSVDQRGVEVGSRWREEKSEEGSKRRWEGGGGGIG